MQSNFGQRDFGHHRHHPHPQHHSPRLGHGGRGGRIAAAAAIVLLSTWAGTATLYILFRDDALKLIAGRQVEMNRAYDTQVVSLKAEIERLKSLKLVDQERVDRAVAELSRRQTVLESRQTALNALASTKQVSPARDGSPEITGSVLPTTPLPVQGPSAPGKPTPLPDTILLAPPAEKRAQLESRPLPPLGPRLGSEHDSAHEVRVLNLARSLEKIETEQSRVLNEAEEFVDLAERRMRNVFADLGMKPPSNHSWFGTATGGPFLPFARPPEDAFARQLHRVRTAATAIENLSRGLTALPVRRPIAGGTDVTSGFGVRIDPFVRQLAMHTGVDFRGEPGDPVRAAAGGKVTQAERNGGYGLMVEIDHGNGLASRYAHLSAIEIAEGMTVKPGQLVGRVGTTGRSTGPHLHFEVRLNGEAIDPQKYLRAGLRLSEAM